MKNFIVMFMAFCGWGVFILSCTGEIDNSSKIMAFAPLLAIPQLVRFYGCWEKNGKRVRFCCSLLWVVCWPEADCCVCCRSASGQEKKRFGHKPC